MKVISITAQAGIVATILLSAVSGRAVAAAAYGAAYVSVHGWQVSIEEPITDVTLTSLSNNPELDPHDTYIPGGIARGGMDSPVQDADRACADNSSNGFCSSLGENDFSLSDPIPMEPDFSRSDAYLDFSTGTATAIAEMKLGSEAPAASGSASAGNTFDIDFDITGAASTITVNFDAVGYLEAGITEDALSGTVQSNYDFSISVFDSDEMLVWDWEPDTTSPWDMTDGQSAGVGESNITDNLAGDLVAFEGTSSLLAPGSYSLNVAMNVFVSGNLESTNAESAGLVSGLASPQANPEPATLLLLSGPLLGYAAWRRRKIGR